jgi:phosphate acetyltransferase
VSRFKTLFENRELYLSSKIVLCEQDSDRVKSASDQLRKLGLEILGVTGFQHKTDEYIQMLKRKSFTKYWTDEVIENYLRDPLHFAMTMVYVGDADGIVAGSIYSQEEIVRTALRVLGLKRSRKWLFSSALIASPNGKISSFVDCHLIPEPKPEQLFKMAGLTARFYSQKLNVNPKVAFISFSTNSSHDHYRVTKVKETIGKFNNQYPDIGFIGEVELKNSLLNTDSNVFVFPNMDAGSVAFQFAKYFANYETIGPILNGLNYPVTIISNDSTVDEIINSVLLTGLEVEQVANV